MSGSAGGTTAGDPPQAGFHPARGEHRWPSALAVAVAIVLQLLLPAPMVPQGRDLLPMLELLVGAGRREPVPDAPRVHRAAGGRAGPHRAGRVVQRTVGAAARRPDPRRRVHWRPRRAARHGRGDLTDQRAGVRAPVLGARRWGPRSAGGRDAGGARPRLGQTQNPELAVPGWRPEFVDYLFVAFTAGTSFGPTDVVVLSRRLKVAMMTQAAVALVVVVLVVPGRSPCSGEGAHL